MEVEENFTAPQNVKEGLKPEGDLKPPWKNPEYFLKNVDGISDEDIENYKLKEIKKAE